MSCNPPLVDGTWQVVERRVVQLAGQEPDISDENIQYNEYNAVLESNDFFVKSQGYEGRLGMPGVWRKTNDNFGWELHMVDSNNDNDRFIFTVRETDCHNNVLKMFMINVESGFQAGNDQQTPQVGYSIWTKLNQ